MRQAQIVTYGIDGVVADRLRELAEVRRIWLRETNHVPACRSLVQSAAPPVLVLVLGRDIERELALLEEIHATMPATAIIAIGEADNPALAGLAWDLGATFVLFPPMPVEVIGELLGRFLGEPTT